MLVDLMLPAAEKIVLVLEAIGDGKIQVNSSSLDPCAEPDRLKPHLFESRNSGAAPPHCVAISTIVHRGTNRKLRRFAWRNTKT